jgi:imidazolonepropionase-like amidohydrolase
MRRLLIGLLTVAVLPVALQAQLAVRGEIVHTMAGPAITNGVVLIQGGKIERVGAAADVAIPAGYTTLNAAVVTPGLIDAHTVLGLSGYLNQDHDQDQIERSLAIQPDLSAVDAYNPREALVEWARGYGVTTLHTGHAPGQLVAGQTMIVKTRGRTVDEALVNPFAMVAATLGESARAEGAKSPGTRAKMAAMLRGELLKAQQYARKRATEDEDKRPARDLKAEVLMRVLAGEVPLLITVHRSHDILTALRIAEEFDIKIVLDGVSEAYEVIDQIKQAQVPVIIHPTMYRARGETENLSFETASKLKAAGIPVALQSGFESYVPKSRLVLFETAIAAANGLSFEQALGTITIEAAQILGIADRAGSLEAGKDADLALYDGDPFEYTTHCIGVVIEGEVVSNVVK